jgi:hypothetical protein
LICALLEYGPARARRARQGRARRWCRASGAAGAALTSERQRTLADALGDLAQAELKKAKAAAHRGRQSGTDVARPEKQAS